MAGLSKFSHLEKSTAPHSDRERPTSRAFFTSSFSATWLRYCSTPAPIAATRTSRSHGFDKNRKIRPLFTASIAAFMSEYPVNSIRTDSGAFSRTRARKSAPFIPGMRISEITTANGPRLSRIASPCSPLTAVVTSKWRCRIR
jgi:hypothetical protein